MRRPVWRGKAALMARPGQQLHSACRDSVWTTRQALQLSWASVPHPSRPDAVVILAVGVWAVRVLFVSSAAASLEVAVLRQSTGGAAAISRPPSGSAPGDRLGRSHGRMDMCTTC